MPTTVRSYSKINLGLAIGPARPDGYHALTTCYQTLEAHDLVTVQARPAAKTTIVLSSSDSRVPLDARNTAWKMVDLTLRAMRVSCAVRIHIEKRLPVQGGLGAGSANAVGALLALDGELALHGIASLPGPERLRIAAQVGSDVPLFLIGGSVLGVGHGEEVYPLPDLPATECVLALPEVGVSTPQAFRDWDQRHGGAPEEAETPGEGSGSSSALTGPDESDRLTRLSRVLASGFCPGQPANYFAGKGSHSSGVSAGSEDLAGNGNPLLALVRTGIENDFEPVVFRQHPSLGTIKRILADFDHPETAALYAALSGSGAALFGLYGTQFAAEAAQARLRAEGIRWLRTKTLPRARYWEQVRQLKSG